MNRDNSAHRATSGSERAATPDVGSLSQRAIEAVEALCGRLPLDGCDRNELETAMRELRAVRSFYDTVDVFIARRSRQLAEAGKAGPAADALAHNGRRSKRETTAATNRAGVCDRLPVVENALADGSMSSGHLDAIANATASLTDEQRERFDEHADELTERATTESVESFARYCYELARRVTRDEGESRLARQRSQNSLRHWIDNRTGMYHIRAELDPETGAKVVTALTAHLNTVKHRKNPVVPDADATDPAAQPTRPTPSATTPTGPTAAAPPAAATTTATPTPAEPATATEPAASSATPTGPTAATEQPEPATSTAPVEPATEPTASHAPTDLFTREPAASLAAPPANDPESGPRGASVPTPPSTESRPIEWLSALAFTELVTGAQTLDRRTPEISVLIDLDTLINGLGHDSCCETSTGTLLPPETIRRLACDGDIVPIVLGANGETLDAGRSSRLATPSQRRALRAMYSTCAHPGCQVPFDVCEIHHVKEWNDFGPTDLANLLPLCSKHHHMVHEGGWKLALRSDRTIRLTRPDGTTHFQGSTINRRAREPAA